MRRHCIAAIASLLLSTSAASLTAQQPLSRRDLNALLRTAHTDAEYSRLASYFHERARQFHTLEHATREQMDRALKVGSYSKYPSEYERTRTLWMYYTSREEQAAASEKLFTEKRKALRQGAQQPSGQ